MLGIEWLWPHALAFECHAKKFEGVVSPVVRACQQTTPAISKHVLAKIDCM